MLFFVLSSSVADPERFDMDLDPDPTFHVDAGSDQRVAVSDPTVLRIRIK